MIKGLHHVSMKCATEEEFRRVLTFYREITAPRFGNAGRYFGYIGLTEYPGIIIFAG